VWTRDVSKALKAARAIRAGTVWVNATTCSTPRCRRRLQGIGLRARDGLAGLDHYTEVKTVWVDLS